jgi:cobalt-zinc-cadmium efflux system membrane fusion protein
MNRLLLIGAMVLMTACTQTKTENQQPEDKTGGGLVEISAEAQKHFGLQAETAQIRELDEYLLVPGTVQAIDSRVNTVHPLARGQLHDVLVRVGDRVQKGQTLATYDNIEAGELLAQLASANAELDRLRVQGRNLARQTDRARELADIGAVPKKDFEQATADQQAALQSIKSQEGVIAGIQARLRRFDIPQSDPQSTPVNLRLQNGGLRGVLAGLVQATAFATLMH